MNITQETNRHPNYKSEMVRELHILTQASEELWKHHPNNPKRIDVTPEYLDIQNKIIRIQSEIELTSRNDDDDN